MILVSVASVKYNDVTVSRINIRFSSSSYATFIAWNNAFIPEFALHNATSKELTKAIPSVLLSAPVSLSSWADRISTAPTGSTSFKLPTCSVISAGSNASPYNDTIAAYNGPMQEAGRMSHRRQSALPDRSIFLQTYAPLYPSSLCKEFRLGSVHRVPIRRYRLQTVLSLSMVMTHMFLRQIMCQVLPSDHSLPWPRRSHFVRFHLPSSSLPRYRQTRSTEQHL